jgi:hypothetical protein
MGSSLGMGHRDEVVETYYISVRNSFYKIEELLLSKYRKSKQVRDVKGSIDEIYIKAGVRHFKDLGVLEKLELKEKYKIQFRGLGEVYSILNGSGESKLSESEVSEITLFRSDESKAIMDGLGVLGWKEMSERFLGYVKEIQRFVDAL